MMFMFEFHLIFCEQLLLNAKKLGVEPKNPGGLCPTKPTCNLHYLRRFEDFRSTFLSALPMLSTVTSRQVVLKPLQRLGRKGGGGMGGRADWEIGI